MTDDDGGIADDDGIAASLPDPVLASMPALHRAKPDVRDRLLDIVARERRHQAAGGLNRFSIKMLVAIASGRIAA
jgi:hypothetical protein